ncbi:MAG: hypothetical protein JXN59_14430 [Anaerolineae bacterium]|nr:hypothetical protein [Anaerolineae bacterium]
MTPEILVIGSPSLDQLHIHGRPVPSAGGAGMYTALAAARSGAAVTLYGLKPDPVPDLLRPVAERLKVWVGPVVAPADMPRFEIRHQGDQAEYLNFSIGAEARMRPEDLPADLSRYDAIHVIPLGDSELQLRFLRACRARGGTFLSAGTFLGDIQVKPDAVRQVMEIADVFFMNEAEAACVFGSLEGAEAKPGKLLFITLGRQGALVLQGGFQTRIPAAPADILDPTGAGDTFCGAALADIAGGHHPLMAARMAAALAAEEITAVGPAALLRGDPAPGVPLDAGVEIDAARVWSVAEVLGGLSEAGPFDFTGADYAPGGHPLAMEFFFVSTLQQFSFWEARDGKYDLPMIAPLDGVTLKGSAYLYHSYLRPLAADPEFFSPERQARLSAQELLAVYRADDGADPMPAFDLHLKMARQYGRDMLALGLTPREIVRRANASETPLKTFLRILDQVGGYREDPLRKKSTLLALILNQRPENFLRIGADEAPKPVVDYHAMRSALRSGMVVVRDNDLEKRLAERRLLTPAEEWRVRFAVYRVQEQVARLSGKPIGAVDWFFFNYMRAHCPEMSVPVCGECALDGVCAKRVDLFQPVIRTTFY